MANRPEWQWFRRAGEQAAAGQLDAAEDTIEAALEAGHLWRISLFLTPTLDPLRGRERFESLSAEARRRVFELQLKPLVRVAMPAHPAPMARLLLVLHGATGNAQSELERWRPATDLGWIVAAGQSSQPATRDGFCWDPPRERVWQDLRTIVAMLPPHARVALAGFSQGAWVAVNAALAADIVVSGTVFMVGPFAGPDQRLAPAWRRLRVTILTGDRDPYRERVELFAKQLSDRGHHVKLEVVANLDHAYPPDFTERLPKLLRP